MFQSRYRDSRVKLHREGMKLQDKSRKFQSRQRDLQVCKLFGQQKFTNCPSLYLRYHSHDAKI
jgi:hypothetical protein